MSESRGRQVETGHAERRVQQLSAFARGIICEFDGECRYLDVWTTDERLLAMPSQQLLGRTIVEALGEEIGRPLMDGTARVFATGTPRLTSTRCRWPWDRAPSRRASYESPPREVRRRIGPRRSSAM